MKLKNFDIFEKYLNGKTEDITNKIQILSENLSINNSPFNHISSIDESNGTPILICNNFKISNINESDSIKEHFYNSFNINSRSNFISKYTNESFIPRSTKKRNDIKRLTFPIEAIGTNINTQYKTLNKFNKSENVYHTFREKINPKTKYEVLMFRNKPIDIVEKINDSYKYKKMDTHINKSISKIVNKINESHKLDVYYIKIYESANGKIYFSGINKCNSLNERQANFLYMKLYEDHYEYPIPTWFKNKINSIYADN